MNVKAKSNAESNRANLENVCTFSPSIGGFLITVAARYKAWVCGCWLAGFTGSNPAGEGATDVCLLWVLCLMSVRADHLSGGVLPSVACVSVISKCRQWGGPGHLGLSSHEINWWLPTIGFQNYFVMSKKNGRPQQRSFLWLCRTKFFLICVFLGVSDYHAPNQISTTSLCYLCGYYYWNFNFLCNFFIFTIQNKLFWEAWQLQTRHADTVVL